MEITPLEHHFIGLKKEDVSEEDQNTLRRTVELKTMNNKWEKNCQNTDRNGEPVLMPFMPMVYQAVSK